MPDFTRIINMAYMRILDRAADPGGLENYNRLLNDGMSEAQMRETLIRSDEYASKNPDTTAVRLRATRAGTKARARSAKKKKRKTAKKKANKNKRGSKPGKATRRT